MISSNSKQDVLPHQDPNHGSPYIYAEKFFRYIEEGSLRSAHQIVPRILQKLKVQSILDVGCGAGAWLSEYRNHGLSDVLGVDGSYVQAKSLLIPPALFEARDITQPFDLNRNFDLVQCLEVGEHIPKSSSRALVENLVRHGRAIVFSAAVPGQGGENHINEQPFEFWRLLFNSHGYKPFDFIRYDIAQVPGVEAWYRNNMILYVSESLIPRLSTAIADTQVPDTKPIPNISGNLYKIRTQILSFLPVNWLSRLAIAKHRFVLIRRAVLGRSRVARFWRG